MRVYEEDILKDLQRAIDLGEATIERQAYGFLDKLDSAGIRIELYYDERLKMNMGQFVTSNYNIDGNYIRSWRSFPPGRYLIKDFRKQITNANGECPYHIVHWKTDEEEPCRAILRELLSDDKDDIDVTINKNVPCKVIKIVDEDETPEGWMTFEPMVFDITHANALVVAKEHFEEMEDQLDEDPDDIVKETTVLDETPKETEPTNTLF